jgi:hypothetical protein
MRSIAILTVLALVAGACGASDEVEAASAPLAAAQPEDAGEQPAPDDDDSGDLSELEAIGDVEVERGLLSVEITIPASLAGEADIDGLVAEVAAEGITIADARRNPDGSITYKMSRGDHRRLLGSLRDSFKESFEEVPDDFPSIRSITFNDDLTRFRMTVDRPAFENSFDGFVVFLPLFAAGIYAAFDGRNPEGMRIEIDYVDAATGQVYDTFVAPDDLQD